MPSLRNEQRAQCCLALANNYRTCAMLLLNLSSRETLVPSLFLLLHAFELYLKAFLVLQGLSDKKLRAIGHDLLACLRVCDERGFSKAVDLSWREKMQIARINRYYKNKELEYFTPQAKFFGCVEFLVVAVDRISKKIFPLITEKTFFNLIK